MQHEQKAWSEFVTYCAISTLLYFGTYHLNTWLPSSVAIAPYVSLIYLPAAIRVLAVLVMGLPAAVGLMLGTLLSIYTTEGAWEHVWYETLPTSFISGFGALLAVSIGTRLLKLPADLAGLQPLHLLQLSILGAVCNAIPTNTFFWLMGHISAPLDDALLMFSGDVIGSLVMLWLAATAVKLISNSHR